MRIAVQHEHGHAVPHGHGGLQKIVRLQRVGIRANLDDVRTGRIKRVREEHLLLLAHAEVDLRNGLLDAIGEKLHAQFRIRALAVIPDGRAQLHRLPDAENEPRKIERFDGHVVAALLADLNEREARLRVLFFQHRREPRARGCLALGPAHALEITHHDQLAIRIAHRREQARARAHRVGDIGHAEARIDLRE